MGGRMPGVPGSPGGPRSDPLAQGPERITANRAETSTTTGCGGLTQSQPQGPGSQQPKPADDASESRSEGPGSWQGVGDSAWTKDVVTAGSDAHAFAEPLATRARASNALAKARSTGIVFPGG